MRSPAGWWRGLSGPDKFRAYTRLTLQFTGLVVLASLILSAQHSAALPGMLVAGLAALPLIEMQPCLTPWRSPAARRLAVILGGAAIAAVWLAYAVLSHLAEDEEVFLAARYAGFFSCMIAALALLPFARRKWWWLLALAAVTGLAYAGSWQLRLAAVGLVLGVGGFVLGSMVVTAFSLKLVDDLDQARELEARLQVADERLRFSRDLHDVVGRGFSAIAVKSELAATLARAGAGDRAAAEMDEVKTLAVESMEQMRGLVRGYRDIDLANEVAGARSLLAAAGCRLEVQGDPARLPERFHELAAWATREGTTNIVKHSSAREATLAFGPAGMSLRNDGVRGGMNERSGLRGLAERAEAAGASLKIRSAEEEFVLEIVWEAP